jgi:hypothetical protein
MKNKKNKRKENRDLEGIDPAAEEATRDLLIALALGGTALILGIIFDLFT